MSFAVNFPFFSIVMSLMTGVICSVLKPRAARVLQYVVIGIITVFSVCVLIYTLDTGSYFIYRMGHYFAPWGNEIRAGVLEALLSLFFTLIMFISLIAGEKYIAKDVASSKLNLYYSLTSLLMSSLLALTYTNDLFTAYVFVEINTISACGLIAVKGDGKAILSSVKYMVMSLVGSGLLLISIALLYDITGHLLMQNIYESVKMLVQSGEHARSLRMVVCLMTAGLGIKSALFPFHAWLPEAYGNSTVSSSAILSSLVSKAYIVLLIKLFIRVVGYEYIVESHIADVILVFGIIAMIVGSVIAIFQNDIKRMVAYSSVAQIGYIFMGFGIGVIPGIIASIFHIFMHSSAKSMLFVSLEGLSEVSGGSSDISSLKGAAHKNKLAGLAFSMGGLSMIGIPLLPGFISKLSFGRAAVLCGGPQMIAVLLALVISTGLNVIYFFRVILKIYEHGDRKAVKLGGSFDLGMCLYVILNLVIGCMGVPVLDWISKGLLMF